MTPLSPGAATDQKKYASPRAATSSRSITVEPTRGLKARPATTTPIEETGLWEFYHRQRVVGSGHEADIHRITR